MIVVSDTSPLCNLILVNHLWLLREIYEVVMVPAAVAEELAAANNMNIQNICTLEWIQTRELNDQSFATKLCQERGLDLGEAQAIKQQIITITVLSGADSPSRIFLPRVQ